ncbi:MAG: alanine racemase [Myxococcota bacterium]|nr:alanine racemase [Myxococcota bacterium]
MSASLPETAHISWCEISRAALGANVEIFRQRLAPGARLGMVVKANAYGHGMIPCAHALVDAGVDWLVVNDAPEALELRRAGIEAPVYICGPVFPSQAGDVVEARAEVVAYHQELLDALSDAATAAGRVVPVHLKAETGNHRQGVPVSDLVQLASRAQELSGVRLAGLATHFADIEDTTDHGFARQQLAAFQEAIDAVKGAGFEVGMVHSANSAAAILWPETHGDLVRVGIATYGLWPSTETYATALQAHAMGQGGMVPELQPVLRWRTRIAQVKEVQAGSYVGYGRTYRTTHASRIAVLPVGYHEGYDRRLSNLAHVLVDGRRAPVRGRVCMNMTMVDVTHVPGVHVGQEVTLLGQDGQERVTAEDVGAWMGSINYEVVSRIHPAVPRVLV